MGRRISSLMTTAAKRPAGTWPRDSAVTERRPGRPPGSLPDVRPGWEISARYLCVMRLGQAPGLVRGAGAGPDLRLGAGAAPAGVVQALAGVGIEVGAVGLVD